MIAPHTIKKNNHHKEQKMQSFGLNAPMRWKEKKWIQPTPQ